MKRPYGASGHDVQLEAVRKAGDRGITCQEYPCISVYVPIDLYPSHVQQYHDHCCAQCGKNLVTENLLHIHLDEVHNPFNAGNSVQYRCFEERCGELFSSHKDRVCHLMKVHEYPDTFDFDVVRNGQPFS